MLVTLCQLTSLNDADENIFYVSHFQIKQAHLVNIDTCSWGSTSSLNACIDCNWQSPLWEFQMQTFTLNIWTFQDYRFENFAFAPSAKIRVCSWHGNQKMVQKCVMCHMHT